MCDHATAAAEIDVLVVQPPSTRLQLLEDLLLDLLRALQLGVYFLPSLLLAPVAYFSRHETMERWWGHLLAHTMQWSGPAFVKLGQWISTRSDMFPLGLRESLSVLHDNVNTESWSKTQQTLNEAQLDQLTSGCLAVDEHGDGVASVVIESVEQQPLGAGCIAQVHKAMATIKYNDGTPTRRGVPVALKIKRRDVDMQIHRDLSLLLRMASLVQNVFDTHEWLVLDECIGQFAQFMRSQLDLRIEGRNLVKFASNFEAFGETVRFPSRIASTRDVLVETLEEGVLLSRVLQTGSCSASQEATKKEIANIGVHAFLKMVLVDNFCHSDLHPGNIIVRTKRDEPGNVEGLTFIDVGLATSLDGSNRTNFVDLFKAVALGKGKEAGQLILERSRKCCHGERVPRNCIDPRAFVEGVDRIVSRVNCDSFCLEKVEIGDVLENIMRLVQKHRVELDPNFSTLILSIIVLEGVGRQLDPDLDIFNVAMPILMRSSKTCYTKRFRRGASA